MVYWIYRSQFIKYSAVIVVNKQFNRIANFRFENQEFIYSWNECNYWNQQINEGIIIERYMLVWFNADKTFNRISLQLIFFMKNFSWFSLPEYLAFILNKLFLNKTYKRKQVKYKIFSLFYLTPRKHKMNKTDLHKK